MRHARKGAVGRHALTIPYSTPLIPRWWGDSPYTFSVYSLEHERGNGNRDTALFRSARTDPGTRNNHPPVPATSSGNGQETYEAVSLKVEKGWAKSLALLA